MEYDIEFLGEEVDNLRGADLPNKKRINYDFYVYRVFFSAKKAGWKKRHKICTTIRVRDNTITDTFVLHSGINVTKKRLRKKLLNLARKTMRDQIGEPE